VENPNTNINKLKVLHMCKRLRERLFAANDDNGMVCIAGYSEDGKCEYPIIFSHKWSSPETLQAVNELLTKIEASNKVSNTPIMQTMDELLKGK